MTAQIAVEKLRTGRLVPNFRLSAANRDGQVGPWDYKQKGHEYEDFGNFNYGATGRATGLSRQMQQRGAGYAQWKSGNRDPRDGFFLGLPPYGDDPKDQAMIIKGMEYYECGCWKR